MTDWSALLAVTAFPDLRVSCLGAPVTLRGRERSGAPQQYIGRSTLASGPTNVRTSRPLRRLVKSSWDFCLVNGRLPDFSIMHGNTPAILINAVHCRAACRSLWIKSPTEADGRVFGPNLVRQHPTLFDAIPYLVNRAYVSFVTHPPVRQSSSVRDRKSVV